MAVTGSDNPEGTQPGSDDEPKAAVFSQADVDNLIGKMKAKLNREFTKREKTIREEAITGWRDEQGLDDEVLAKAIEAPNELEAVKRELRTTKTSHTKLQNAYEAALKGRDEANAALRKIYGRDEVTRAANKLRAHNADAVWKWVKDQIDFDDDNKPLVVDSEGNPAGTTIEQLIEGLRDNESTQFMFRPDEGVEGGGSRTTPAGGNATQSGRSKEELLRALAAYHSRD
jgi:hypothetical protein